MPAPSERRAAPPVPPLVPARRKSYWARHEHAVQWVSVLALLWGAAYLGWRAGWSGRGAEPVRYWLLLGAEAFGFVSLACYVFMAWRVPASRRPARRGAPTVDVLVTTYDEPRWVLEATLTGCRAITYPHTTYVLDDGRRPDVERLAVSLGARYLTRPDNSHAKAGNINHALSLTSGELLLVLDADHVPNPEILDATLGYFDDADVALVQTPHDFYNRDSFQHTRPERHEQTLFYDVIAPGKDRHNAVFWCGSAAVIRRDALVAVGGVRTDTVAEDFHTTIAMHARGWRSRYHNETLVQGLAPHDLGGFLLQRERWARGNLRVFRTPENPLTARGLRPGQRISYTASLLNYFSGAQRAVMLGVLALTLLTGRLPMTATPEALATLWLPWAVLGFTATLALSRGALGPADSTVYALRTMGIFVRAAVSLLWPRAGRFKVTPKEGVDHGGLAVLRMLASLSMLGAVLVSAVGLRALAVAGWVPLPRLGGLALAVSLALGVWELWFLGRAILPAVRRRQRRHHYRFPVDIRARIAGTGTVVPLRDLSPAGLGFESPIKREAGERTRLLTRLPDARGTLHPVALPVEVRTAAYDEERAVWRMGCSLDGLDETARALVVEYCHVVHPAARLGASTRPATGNEPAAATAS